MAEIILSSDTNPGGRKYNEDRCATEAFRSKAGKNLAIAIVCDGVGGEERGERAAQLALDSFLAFMRESDIPETPRLLYQAVKTANLAAFNEAQRLDAGERMACTMVVAVIEEGTTLYISNVGDSRIYLSHGGQLRQLTHDHTFANVMVWMGKLSAEAARSNPDASKVMRVLGTKPDVQPDLGMYLTTTDYGEANRIGRAGLQLEPGDSVVVCSDGLVKDTATTGQPLVQNKEIVQILNTDEGPKAARGIMGIALGRIPVGEQVDNISLALAQTEDPNRAINAGRQKEKQAEQQRADTTRKMALIAGLVGLPLCVLLLVALGGIVGVYNIFNTSLGGTSTELANATQLALAQTQTVAAYTPTPTIPPPTNTPVPTAIPTLASDEIAKLFQGEELLRPIVEDELVAAPPAQPWYLAVKHTDELSETGNVHLTGSTQLQFNRVSDPRFEIRLLVGSDIFVQTGPYPNGVEIELAGLSVLAKTEGQGCLAAYFPDNNTFTADCFQGTCALSTNFGTEFTEFQQGQRLTLDLSQLSNTEQPPIPEEGPIPQSDISKYFSLLNLTSAGRSDMRRCNVPNLVATQTAQAAQAIAAAATRSAAAAAAPAAAQAGQAAPAATAQCQSLQSQGTPCP